MRLTDRRGLKQKGNQMTLKMLLIIVCLISLNCAQPEPVQVPEINPKENQEIISAPTVYQYGDVELETISEPKTKKKRTHKKKKRFL